MSEDLREVREFDGQLGAKVRVQNLSALMNHILDEKIINLRLITFSPHALSRTSHRTIKTHHLNSKVWPFSVCLYKPRSGEKPNTSLNRLKLMKPHPCTMT